MNYINLGLYYERLHMGNHQICDHGDQFTRMGTIPNPLVMETIYIIYILCSKSHLAIKKNMTINNCLIHSLKVKGARDKMHI